MLVFSIFCLLVSSSCSEDDTTNEEPIEDPADIGGRFSDFISCDVISPPEAVNLNSYYKKYINCNGIPVIGAEAVPDEALIEASNTLEFMLNGLNDVTRQLVIDGNYVSLYPEGGAITDLPENFIGTGPFTTGVYNNTQTLKAVASDVSSLLCQPEAGFGHTLVHEIAHMIDIGGYRQLGTSFANQLDALYQDALSSGTWQNTYASSNAIEYLAEAVTIYYGVNWIGPEGGDGSRNNIGTRALLQQNDAGIFNLINANFNSQSNIPGCRIPVLTGNSTSCANTVTDIDGNVYEIVDVGPMCWMKENLRTTRFKDGSSIANPTNDNEWQNINAPAWANYANETANDAIYGKLYNGFAFEDPRGICPEGWRVPTYQELQDLVNYGGNGDYGSAHLRDTALWNPSDFPSTNSSGFSALPGGQRLGSGSFNGLGNRTNFGSTYVNPEDKYASKAFFNDQEYIFTDALTRDIGLSCRCIKD